MRVTRTDRISHKIDFEKMMKKSNDKLYQKLSDVVDNAGKELAKGQEVYVVNGYGIEIGPFEIMGFCNPEEFGRCVYLDWDCYWFPAKPENIITE